MAAYIPPEIIILIVSKINELRDRLPFLRVCKFWYSLLWSTVFSSIRFRDPYLLTNLVCAVHRGSNIADAIRTIDCDLFSFNGDKAKQVCEAAYNPSLLRKSVRSVAKWPCSRAEWELRMISGHEDVWLCLLFLKLQGIKKLCLKPNRFSHISRMVERVVFPLSDNNRNIVALQHLEILHVGSATCYGDYNVGLITPFFLLPSMRVFRGYRVHEEVESMLDAGDEQWEYDCECYPRYVDWELPAGSSSIREIILEESNGEDGSREIIAACASLERFEYQHTNEAIWEKTYLNFRPREFYDPLKLHYRTLQKLRLNDMGMARKLTYDEYDLNGKRDPEVIEGWFGSLAEFTALKELRIPLRTLIGDDKTRHRLKEVLPPCLGILCLAHVDRQDYELLISELRTLLGGGFSALREVIVQLFQVELHDGKTIEIPSFAMKAFKGTKEAYLTAGVDFILACDRDHQIVRGCKVIRESASVDRNGYEYRISDAD